jgi:hypothetical protein
MKDPAVFKRDAWHIVPLICYTGSHVTSLVLMIIATYCRAYPGPLVFGTGTLNISDRPPEFYYSSGLVQ